MASPSLTRVRGPVTAWTLLLLVVLAGCSPSSAITAEGADTPPPPELDRLTIAAPKDGATVTSSTVVVSGTAPDGADVVREVRFGRDEHVTANGGRWSMEIVLDEGDNLLTFRLGDDEATSSTLLVSLAGGSSSAATPEPTSTPDVDPTEAVETEAPDATDEPDAADMSVKVVKRTSSVARNGTASVTIKTVKGATCSIDVRYHSGSSTASGLGNKKSDGSGKVAWKWQVGGRTAKGSYPIYIACEKGDRYGNTQTTFRVR